jgi:hypothetical protein
MSKKHLATTQEHLDVYDIKNGIVVLKNGSAVCILETNAINFDLLSMQEQDAAIAAYSNLLNSLTFPIQVTIRSKKMDISDYIEKVREAENKQSNPKIKEQIIAYRRFIEEELVTKENVLDKNFYVTIPYKLMSSSSTSPFGFFEDLLGLESKNKTRVNTDKVLAEAHADLEPKKNFLIKEFARIGIKANALNTADLIKLFYEIYNSETSQSQRIRGNVDDFTSALVEPKLKT